MRASGKGLSLADARKALRELGFSSLHELLENYRVQSAELGELQKEQAEKHVKSTIEALAEPPERQLVYNETSESQPESKHEVELKQRIVALEKQNDHYKVEVAEMKRSMKESERVELPEGQTSAYPRSALSYDLEIAQLKEEIAKLQSESEAALEYVDTRRAKRRHLGLKMWGSSKSQRYSRLRAEADDDDCENVRLRSASQPESVQMDMGGNTFCSWICACLR